MEAVIYGYMVVAYSILVQGGKFALSPDDNPKNLNVVPESYREKVAEWIVTHLKG